MVERSLLGVGRDTYAECHVQACGMQAGSAAAAAETLKSRKYADITAGVDFVPVAIEMSGVWGEQALNLVRELGRRIAMATHEPRATVSTTTIVGSGAAWECFQHSRNFRYYSRGGLN